MGIGACVFGVTAWCVYAEDGMVLVTCTWPWIYRMAEYMWGAVAWRRCAGAYGSTEEAREMGPRDVKEADGRRFVM